MSEQSSDITAKASVPQDLHGARLDAAAARVFPAWSRARLKAWIECGRLRLNGVPARKPRQPVCAGDRLWLSPEPAPDEAHPAAQALPLEVIYHDDAIAVIAKPPGLTVHPGAGVASRTLLNALLHHFPQTRQLPRAGLVHRLDKDTSGVLVVALTLPAHARLVRAMQAREIRREYDALVAGWLSAGGTVDAPIGRHPRHRTRMAVTASGRSAVTHYRVIERFAAHTWLRVRLETGRTHQIRVHLAHIKHPIIGDRAYGDRAARGAGLPEAVRAALEAFPRQALHARLLALRHPVTEREMQWEIEPPEEMKALLDVLRGVKK